MFISILLVIVAFMLVLSVKARFDKLPVPLRNSLLGLAAALTALVMTIELFIYGKLRLQAFLAAVDGVPWFIVAAVFAVLVLSAFWVFRMVTRINRREVARIYREHFKPLVGEVVQDVRTTWKEISWRKLLWPPFGQRKPEDESEGKEN